MGEPIYLIHFPDEFMRPTTIAAIRRHTAGVARMLRQSGAPAWARYIVRLTQNTTKEEEK